MKISFSKQIHEQLNADPDIFLLHNSDFLPMVGLTNCYIIRDGEEALVIDAGPPLKDKGQRFRESLAQLNLNIDNLSFFFTHLHFDHCGAAASLIKSNNKIYISKSELVRTKSDFYTSHAELLYKRLVKEGISFAMAKVSKRYVEGSAKTVCLPGMLTTLEEGDTIRVGRYELTLVDTSGHTQGHASLYEPKSRSLFVGDHVLYNISPSVDHFLDNLDGVSIYLENLRKLREYDIAHFFQAHGKVRDDFFERIDWLSAHHKERFRRIENVIAEQPDILGAEVIKKMGWNTLAKTWALIPLLQKSIILIQGIAILDHLVSTNKIKRHCDKKGKYRYRIASNKRECR